MNTGIQLTTAQRRTLRRARETAGLSRNQAASKAGIAQSTWGRVESGIRGVSLETLDAMARAVGLRARLVLEQRGR